MTTICTKKTLIWVNSRATEPWKELSRALLVGGLVAINFIFPEILGIIIPTDEIIFFQRGSNHQPAYFRSVNSILSLTQIPGIFGQSDSKQKENNKCKKSNKILAGNISVLMYVSMNWFKGKST